MPVTPTHVCLIHGTGAAIPDGTVPRWWQKENAFAIKLSELLYAASDDEHIAPAAGRPPQSPRPVKAWALPLAASLVLVALAGSAYVASIASVDSYLVPYTNVFQEQAILRSISVPAFQVQALPEDVAPVLAWGLLLGHESDVLTAISSIPDVYKRSESFRDVSTFAGYMGQFDVLPRLAGAYWRPGSAETRMSANIYGIVGAALAGLPVPRDLLLSTYRYVFETHRSAGDITLLSVAALAFKSDAIYPDLQTIILTKPSAANTDPSKMCDFVQTRAALAGLLARTKEDFDTVMMEVSSCEQRPNLMKAAGHAQKAKNVSLARVLLASHTLVTPPESYKNHTNVLRAINELRDLIAIGMVENAGQAVETLMPVVRAIRDTPFTEEIENPRYDEIWKATLSLAGQLPATSASKGELADAAVEISKHYGEARNMPELIRMLQSIGADDKARSAPEQLLRIAASEFPTPSLEQLTAAAEVLSLLNDKDGARAMRQRAFRMAANPRMNRLLPQAMLSLYRSSTDEGEAFRALEVAQASVNAIDDKFQRDSFAAALSAAWLDLGDLRRSRESARLAISPPIILQAFTRALRTRVTLRPRLEPQDIHPIYSQLP